MGNYKKTRKKEDSLQDQIEYLESIIGLMPGHVYWKDVNGVLQGCNDEQAKDIGLKSRKEVVGLTAYDTLPKKLADAITRVDAEVMSKGIPKTVQEVLTLPTGKKSIWLSKKVPLRNKQGNIIGLLGISFDITEQKRTRKKLQEAKIKLEGMTAVSTSVAHELRTPLAALNLKKDNLRDYLPQLIEAYEMAQAAGLPVKPMNKTHLKLINNSIESMSIEIKSALTFIDMLLMNLKPSLVKNGEEVFPIAETIKDAIVRYPFELNETDLIQLDLCNDFKIKTKKVLITYVIFNLIKNSLYYIAKAGKGTISIWLEHAKDYNKVYFKDTGAGIPNLILSKIFNRFFTQTPHGAGVGLTFCKMVMQSLGGDIACESKEGYYTLFILKFPKLKAKDEI